MFPFENIEKQKKFVPLVSFLILNGLNLYFLSKYHYNLPFFLIVS